VSAICHSVGAVDREPDTAAGVSQRRNPSVAHGESLFMTRVRALVVVALPLLLAACSRGKY
jgi:hypothetical protein